jgi:hypothetical protein
MLGVIELEKIGLANKLLYSRSQVSFSEKRNAAWITEGSF